MVLLRGHRISVPAYCYPRYDYFRERAATLRKYFERIEGSAEFHRDIDLDWEIFDLIIRKPLKSKLNICVLYKEEDSDFFESKQFLIKVADEEYKTELVAIPTGHFLYPPSHTDTELPRIYIIVLSGELSEVSMEDDYFFTFPQKHTYFVSKDKKMCCKMKDIFKRDQWTDNLSHLVQSHLEKTVIKVVKQMEQFMTKFLSFMEAFILGNTTIFLKHLEDSRSICFCRLLGLAETYTNVERLQIFCVRHFMCCIFNEISHLVPLDICHQLKYYMELTDSLKKAITVSKKYEDKNAVEMYSMDYRCALNPVIKRIESFLTSQMEILKRAHRLQFLIRALLRQSPLTCKDIKEPTKLPKELQQDLLKKPFVTGCGTIFGELVIHVKSATSEEQNKEIEDCMKPYGNLFPYKVEVFVPVCRKTAGQGNCIRAEKLTSSHDETYNHSSLGCFVDVKIKESDQKEVHFITCHHCLNDCSDKVSVWGQNMEYEDLGLKKHSHKAADIALVQVIKPHLISKGLKHNDGERECDKWQFYQDGEYLGRQVYKVGATSGTTKGVIVSDNYLLNPEILADELPPNMFLIAPYSALDVPVQEQRAGAADVQHPFFSYEGHSGSVVFDTNPYSGDGLELGLLHGCVFDESNPERSIYSYTRNMKSALNMHKEKHRGADAADVQHPFFSYEGDSGSVVCDINPDSGDGLVLGLLHGCVFDENNPEHYIYSYASNMKSALNMLKEKHPDIESIEPSLDQAQYSDLPGAAAF